MAAITVTNTSGATLNGLALGEDGVATGGARTNALPHPCSHLTIAPAGSAVVEFKPSDYRFKRNAAQPLESNQEWNQMVQAGKLTLSVTDRGDAEEGWY